MPPGEVETLASPVVPSAEPPGSAVQADLSALSGMVVTDGTRLGRLWEFNPLTGFCVVRHLTVSGMEWTAHASTIRPVSP
jgi:hypothetical protein